jgi:uncharacterized membrane protein
MNTGAITFLVLAALGVIVGGGIYGIAALAAVRGVRRAADDAARRVDALSERLDRVERRERGPIPPAEPTRAEPPRATTVPIAPAPPEPVVRPRVPEAFREAAADRPAMRPQEAEAGEPWAAFEARVGKRWMTWLGAVVLVLSVGFFVKYAVDNRWIGPAGRVVLTVLLGVVLLAAGDRAVRRAMRALGLGLMGAGLAALYVALFAAFARYHLLPQAAAFVAMVVVTAGGLTLGVLHRAMSTSVLAVLGGFLTPVMLSTGGDARDVLFAYVLVLDLGVLGVAFFRSWRALDVLAFIGTAVLYGGWYEEHYRTSVMAPALLWLGSFYLIFLLLPFVYHLRWRSPATIERFTMALTNAAAAFFVAYRTLRIDHAHVLGFVVLGMSACYVVLGSMVRRRIMGDSRSLFGFITLGVFFLTMAVPLHLSVHGIMLAWAVEGPVLLYLGYRFQYFPVRVGGLIVLMLAGIRLFTHHWPIHELYFVPVWNARFAGAMCVPAAAWAFALVHHRWRKGASAEWDRRLQVMSAVVAGIVALIIAHGEAHQWFTLSPGRWGAYAKYYAWCAGQGVWTAGAAAFLAAGLAWRSGPARVAALASLVVAVCMFLLLYSGDAPQGTALFANPRFLVAFVTAVVAFAWGVAVLRLADRCTESERAGAVVVPAAAGIYLPALLSTEVFTFAGATITDQSRARWVGHMSLSLVWGLYATAMLALGFRLRVRPLRLCALALFGVTAVKLAIVDIAHVQQIYRIISFVVLGALMIGASYLYHRIERRLSAEVGAKP